MAVSCPKCGKAMPEDSVYCPHCGYGVKPSAKTTQVSVGGTLLIVGAVGSLIIFAQSVKALLTIYSWYPLHVAQAWTPYDQLVLFSALAELLFGLCAGVLALARRSYRLTLVLAVLTFVSGLGTWAISMVTPSSNAVLSFYYFFLPLFLPSLVGTALVYSRRAEFK